MKSCPDCGLQIPQSKLQGLCPRCLLKGAVYSQLNDPLDLSVIQQDFPNHELIRVLGTGGTALVYEARELATEKRVALKVLSPEMRNDQVQIERLRREFELLSRLEHPNIVSANGFSETERGVSLSLEYLEGQTLRELMLSKALTSEKIKEVLLAVIRGLNALHETGVVHRDIKPENIVVTRDKQIKIVDLGLIKDESEELQLTAGQYLPGTYGYMAPEQFQRDKQIDRRCDYYSLAVMAYELLSGELPRGQFQKVSEVAAPEFQDLARDIELELHEYLHSDKDMRPMSLRPLSYAIDMDSIDERDEVDTNVMLFETGLILTFTAFLLEVFASAFVPVDQPGRLTRLNLHSLISPSIEFAPFEHLTLFALIGFAPMIISLIVIFRGNQLFTQAKSYKIIHEKFVMTGFSMLFASLILAHYVITLTS